MLQILHDSLGTMFVLDADLAEFGLQPGIGEMDGELSSIYISHHRYQGHEQDHGRQADQQVGEHQFVAQAPQHVLPHQPPEQRKRNADQGDADKYLQNAEEGPEASGNLPRQEKEAEPDAKPECRPGKACRQPCPEPGADLRLGRATLTFHYLPPPPPPPALPVSTCNVWPKNGLRRATADRRETPTSSTLPKYKTDRTPTESPATATP